MKKATRNLMLAVVMAVLCFAMAMTAGAATTEDGFIYTVSNGEVTITGYEGSSTDLIIPEEIEGYLVTTIGKEAFDQCENLKSITISDTVTTIEDFVFARCISLESITIPDSVTYFGDHTFYECYALKDVTIGNGVSAIGDFTFAFCYSLEDVTIGNSVEAIYECAFYGCRSLESLIIPDSVTYIEGATFVGCENLTEVIIGNSVETIGLGTFAGCVNLKSLHIPESVTSIGEENFWCCMELTAITVDENNSVYSSDENGVLFNKDKTVLLQYPSARKSTSYTVPETVKSIAAMAFNFCRNLKSVTIPGTVETVSSGAFYYCLYLEDVVIEDGVGKMEVSAFADNLYLNSITIKDVDVIIEEGALNYNEIKVVGIDRDTFMDCYKRFIGSGGDEAVLDEFEDCMVQDYHQAGTIYCHEGSTAEACAIENDFDYVLTHFYEDEWNYDADNACRFKKCIHCDEAVIEEHDMGEFVVTKEATCSAKGEERADCSRCDYSEARETEMADHKDENLDGYCDSCDEYVADEDCICICHAKTIGAFVYKLFRFIDKFLNTNLVSKVFGITDICTCGIKHW